MEIVLGVSMTPTTVSIALVEGEKADGVIIDHDVFEITAVDGSATSSPPEHVIAAILGTQEGAFAAGHHLVSTGVTWTHHDEAAALREALVDRDIEGVLLVSELHAAAALAQTVGRAVGYDKTALMFVEREKATLAVVETVDGSVVKVRSQSLHDGREAISVVGEMVTNLQAEEWMLRGLFVVGSGVDVTAVKAHLQDVVSVPVIAPEEPGLALARGAALASASAPRYDTSTIGLAYSQAFDGTTAYQLAPADGATAFLGVADAAPDATDIASNPDDVTEPRKPFLLVGSSLAAIFVAGMMALTIALVVNIRPTADQGSEDTAARPGAAAPPAMQGAPPAPQLLPPRVPAPPPVSPSTARLAVAQLMELPAPPPRVVVRNAAPAQAAPLPPPAAPPPAPPPFALLPAIPPVYVQWLPPRIEPPPFFNPRFGDGGGGNGRHGGGRGHGHGHGD